jgi:hypothetical protein
MSESRASQIFRELHEVDGMHSIAHRADMRTPSIIEKGITYQSPFIAQIPAHDQQITLPGPTNVGNAGDCTRLLEMQRRSAR